MTRAPLTESQLRNTELLSYIISELPKEQQTRLYDRLGGLLDGLLMMSTSYTEPTKTTSNTK